MPAPADIRVYADAREWSRITVDDSYGAFEMRVPTLSIRLASGANAMVIDSTALREVERRLTARIARVARAEAAALHDTTTPMMPPRSPAPEIKPGLLGTITFPADSTELTAEAQQRVAAVARLATQLGGRLELSANPVGTGALVFDAALLRARYVYLALLRAEPALAQHEVLVTVSTHATIPGAPRQPASVEVFAAAAR